MSPQQMKIPGKSILYSIDANNNSGTEFFQKNNMNATLTNGTPLYSSVGGKRLTLEDIQATSKQRQRLQKSFLDDSKVNKAVARDLMNSKPMFTVQEIQGTQNAASKTHRQGAMPYGQMSQTVDASNNKGQQQQKAFFDYKKTLLSKDDKRVSVDQRLAG